MTARVQLRLSGDADHLRMVWQTGELLLDMVRFTEDPEGTRYNVLVALQEMVTNVLRHAYGGDATRPVEVAFEACSEFFEVTLVDEGVPFDPLHYDDHADADPTEDDDGTLREGGYGIAITRMVMDAMEYERVGGRNVVRLRKQGAAVLQGRT